MNKLAILFLAFSTPATAQIFSPLDCIQYSGKERELCDKFEQRLQERERQSEYEKRKAEIDAETRAELRAYSDSLTEMNERMAGVHRWPY